MAQSLLQKQFKQQVNRIKKGYRSIEKMGGIFSESIEDIIKVPKRITPATIRRLKSITKESLYRRAKTSTGESGWKIRTLVRQESARKGIETKQTIRDVQSQLDRLVYSPYAKVSIREVYKQKRGRITPKGRRKNIAEFAKDFLIQQQAYSDAWEQIKEDEYERRFAEETGTQLEYEDTILSNFEERVKANMDDYGVQQVQAALAQAIETNGRIGTANLLRRDSGEALKLLDDVIKYKDNPYAQAKPLNKLIMLLSGGIAPLSFYEEINRGNENLREVDGQLFDAETGEWVSSSAVYSYNEYEDEEDYM